jgi:hypothetical protein
MNSIKNMFTYNSEPSPFVQKVLNFFNIQEKRTVSKNDTGYQYHLNSYMAKSLGPLKWRRQIGTLGCSVCNRH